MTAKWGSCAILAICLAVLAGCRTPQPNLKPAVTAERFVAPPQEARYDTAGYPAQALSKPGDPMRREMMDPKNAIIPTRGSAIGNPGGGPIR